MHTPWNRWQTTIKLQDRAKRAYWWARFYAANAETFSERQKARQLKEAIFWQQAATKHSEQARALLGITEAP